LYAKEAAFLRTPKTSEQAKWWQAFRANWAETTLAVFGILGIVAGLLRYDTFSGPLLAGLLLFPTLGMLAAPLNSLAAQRAALPAELRERRRTEWLRDRGVARGAAIGGAAAVAAVVAAVVALLLLPGPDFVRPPDLLDPGPNRQPKPSPTAPSGVPGSVPGSVAPSGGGTGTGPNPTTTPGEPTTEPPPGESTPTPTDTETPGDTGSS